MLRSKPTRSSVTVPAVTFALLALASLPALAADVRTQSGTVRGVQLDGEDGMHVFRGIPYAQAPVGELRWRPPRPAPEWDTLDADEFGAICPQSPTLAAMSGDPLPETDEDCLFLNVWTTSPSADAKLPVMVWIHGGGLSLGWSNQGSYDGVELAKRGVVLVSINYRLGPLGFLSLPELSAESSDGVSGNYGFLDQIAALQWVQKNIAGFGGDPGKVTIFGESAGGTSVHALHASPLAGGLFHGVISESAWLTETNVTYLRRETSFSPSAEDLGSRFVSGLAGSESPSLAALREVAADELVQHSQTGYLPVIAVGGPFMPEPGEVRYARGQQHDVPLIAGSNRDEGTMFLAAMPFSTVSEYEEGLRGIYGEHAKVILDLYPVSSDEEVKGAVNELLTDTWFLRGTRAMLHGQGQVSSPAFQYHFTRASKTLPAWGAHHAAEIGYVFNTLGVGGLGNSADDPVDAELAAAMIGYWVQFAKTGDPNVEGLPEWPRFEAGSETYLEFGDEITTGTELGKERNDALDRMLREAGSIGAQASGGQ